MNGKPGMSAASLHTLSSTWLARRGRPSASSSTTRDSVSLTCGRGAELVSATAVLDPARRGRRTSSSPCPATPATCFRRPTCCPVRESARRRPRAPTRCTDDAPDEILPFDPAVRRPLREPAIPRPLRGGRGASERACPEPPPAHRFSCHHPHARNHLHPRGGSPSPLRHPGSPRGGAATRAMNGRHRRRLFPK